MKTKSTIAPEKFKIGDRKGNLIEVAFFECVVHGIYLGGEGPLHA